MNTLTVDELKARVEDGADPGTVLDVRSPDEYASGHVPGAINVPHDQLEGRLDEVPKEGPVYVHCRMGGRAKRAAAVLEANGYDVWCLADEGMGAWIEKGYPTQTP